MFPWTMSLAVVRAAFSQTECDAELKRMPSGLTWECLLGAWMYRLATIRGETRKNKKQKKEWSNITDSDGSTQGTSAQWMIWIIYAMALTVTRCQLGWATVWDQSHACVRWCFHHQNTKWEKIFGTLIEQWMYPSQEHWSWYNSSRWSNT